MTDISPEALDWRGTGRYFRTTLAADHERFVAAVKDYAQMLGLEVSCDESGTSWRVVTGTPETWLGADKLCAYVAGLGDALSNSYGRSWSPARMASGANLAGRDPVTPPG